MGQLLQELADWFGDSYAAFAKRLELSERWFYNSIKYERLDRKTILKIYRKLKIPEAYFEGTFKLPANPELLQEPEVKYNSKLNAVEKENLALKTELLEAYREISSLKSQLLISGQKKNHNSSV